MTNNSSDPIPGGFRRFENPNGSISIRYSTHEKGLEVGLFIIWLVCWIGFAPKFTYDEFTKQSGSDWGPSWFLILIILMGFIVSFYFIDYLFSTFTYTFFSDRLQIQHAILGIRSTTDFQKVGIHQILVMHLIDYEGDYHDLYCISLVGDQTSNVMSWQRQEQCEWLAEQISIWSGAEIVKHEQKQWGVLPWAKKKHKG